MHGELQQILGTDKRNPCFTAFRGEGGVLLLFYGGELLEALPDDRNHAQYKLMVATLYNAGVNARHLQDAFSVDPKTMRGWGRALEEGDASVLVRVLAGRQASRKLTAEIQAYARMRFSRIYPENRRSYSKAIREEIAEVFGVELSAESLRPLFGKLRKAFSFGGVVCADQCNDFYYDPHTKQYTGGLKILKGWCGSRHFADKALQKERTQLRMKLKTELYNELAPFKKSYDNFRDDHVLFRNLTQTPGLLSITGSKLTATLYPTAPHPPTRRKLIEELLGQKKPSWIDPARWKRASDPARTRQKEGIELATRNPPITQI